MPPEVVLVSVFVDDGSRGNIAGVCLLSRPLSVSEMQRIAAEVNVSETAFVEPQGETWSIRWFTPTQEVSLCGHATLAAAFALQSKFRDIGPWVFATRSGILKVWRYEDFWWISLPSFELSRVPPTPELEDLLGVKVLSFGVAQSYGFVELESESRIQEYKPDFSAIVKLPLEGLVITARSSALEYDFVSRCFYPKEGIPEDPVTGSAHAALAPYWSRRLARSELNARQLSASGGVLKLRCLDHAVHVGGRIEFSNGPNNF